MINLKFIGRTCLKIKKFFTPAKWETIWTSKCSGRYTWGGIPFKDSEFTVIVKLDRNKNKVQSYMTDGVHNQDVELAFLVAESKMLAEILKRNNITY
jgi:hypothetical protein